VFRAVAVKYRRLFPKARRAGSTLLFCRSRFEELPCRAKSFRALDYRFLTVTYLSPVSAPKRLAMVAAQPLNKAFLPRRSERETPFRSRQVSLYHAPGFLLKCQPKQAAGKSFSA
jgi:hypothetical protein